MTASLLRRRPRRRSVLVDVTNTWRVTEAGTLREVVVRTPAGDVEVRLLPDSHPAVVRYFERWAA